MISLAFWYFTFLSWKVFTINCISVYISFYFIEFSWSLSFTVLSRCFLDFFLWGVLLVHHWVPLQESCPLTSPLLSIVGVCSCDRMGCVPTLEGVFCNKRVSSKDVTYCFGLCAVFDSAPIAFLSVVTASLALPEALDMVTVAARAQSLSVSQAVLGRGHSSGHGLRNT